MWILVDNWISVFTDSKKHIKYDCFLMFSLDGRYDRFLMFSLHGRCLLLLLMYFCYKYFILVNVFLLCLHLNITSNIKHGAGKKQGRNEFVIRLQPSEAMYMKLTVSPASPILLCFFNLTSYISCATEFLILSFKIVWIYCRSRNLD